MSVLAGLRVLDLSESVAPSVVGMLMADFGAEVVKVERREGDPTRRNPGFAMWNRGKRSVICDREAAEDRHWLAQSLAGADVCLLGAGQQLSEWGPAAELAAVRNARLVLVQMPAYLEHNTPWLGGHESNGLLAAHSGISWRQASEDGAPVEFVYPYLVYIHAVWAAVCAVAALVERERSGFGQRVTVSGMNAVLEAASYNLTVDPNAPDPDTAVGVLGRHPTYRPVRASDAWLACGALGPKFERMVLEVLGIDAILDDPRLEGSTSNMVRPDNVNWVMDQVSAAFLTRPRAHWLRELGARGVPAGPLLDRDDWLDHPQVVANGMRVEVDDPERGHVVMAGVPICLSRSPGQVRGPAPVIGEYTGATPWPPQSQPAGSAHITAGPLSAYRVLNLGTFVATPYAGFLLSELGADVVKVEPVTGDPFRSAGFAFNRGMRSLAVDLSCDAGRELVKQVSSHADVVIDGMRPGVMASLGLDYGQLRAVKADIIALSLSAYGMRGDLARSGGVDMVVQAMSGMMLAQGEPERPVGTTIAMIDVTTAAMTALATVLALLHRERTGEGQQAWNSLIGTSTFLASGETVRFAGRPPAIDGHVDFKGDDALDRFYAVTDGWIRIDVADRRSLLPHNLDRLGQLGELTVASLTSALASVTGAQAVEILAHAGIPATVARRASALFRDEKVRSEQIVYFCRADDGSTIAVPGRYASFSRTQRSGPLRPPGVGEHTMDILAEAGIDPQQASQLLADSVIVAGGRMPMRLAAIYR